MRGAKSLYDLGDDEKAESSSEANSSSDTSLASLEMKSLMNTD
jgi:hypothetical protein